LSVADVKKLATILTERRRPTYRDFLLSATKIAMFNVPIRQYHSDRWPHQFAISAAAANKLID